MANLFGDSMPTLYSEGETLSLTLPVADSEGKIQYFEKIAKIFLDFSKVLQEKIKGYRLRCEYTWSEITPTDLDNLIQFMNKPGQKFIKFSTFPRKFPFIVENMTPGLQYGYDAGDSAKLIIAGTHVLQRYPSIDEMYSVVSPYFRILNTS